MFITVGFGSAASQPIINAPSSSPTNIETEAEQAILVDHSTGIVLFEKNADNLMHPSSMTKLMTAYLLFKMIKENIIHLDTEVVVSENAWKMGGSKMFLPLHSQVTIRNLLKGIIIQSGNDACVAAAEGTMGSESVFAASMTQLAHELGATHSTFHNSSGWPDPNHLTTARDMAIIIQHIINDFPEHLAVFTEREFIFNNIKQYNRNPLLRKNLNCDVGKTGFTDSGKYGLTASAVENGLRVNMVINGLASEKKRAEEAYRLMTLALRTFGTYTLYKKGDLIENAPVWLGEEKTVPLTIETDCLVTIPKISYKDLKVEIRYNSPIKAPLAKNTVVGHLIVTAPTLKAPLEFPLVTAIPLDKAGFFSRISSSTRYLIWGNK